MQACYEDGLRWNADVMGWVITRFTIEPDGTVSRAVEDHDAPDEKCPLPMRFPDPWVAACVVGAFKTLKFPAPKGGRLIVVYPIIFEPQR